MLKRFISLLLILSWVFYGIAVAGPNPAVKDKKKPNKTTTPKKAAYESDYRGKMELSSENFNFGYLPKHSKVGHIFWLKNVGKDSLEVIRIKPG